MPYISLVTLMLEHIELTQRGITTWDKKGKFVVTHGTIGIARTILVIILIIGLTIILIYY